MSESPMPSPQVGNEQIMHAFTEARRSRPQDEELWRKAARVFFESLTPVQRDVLGEIVSNPRQIVTMEPAFEELDLLGAQWRRDRCDHHVDWITR